jgi:hypothetical protein
LKWLSGVINLDWSCLAASRRLRLPQLHLPWAKRQLMLNWAMAGCCAATLLALVIPKQYVSAAKLMPPEAQSASKLALQNLTGGFWFDCGRGLLGGSSSGPLRVAMMRSRTVEDRIIDRFNLKKVYRIALQQEVRARLEVKTAISLEPKGRGPRDLHREQPTRTFFRSARLRTRQSKKAVVWDV